MHVFSFSCSIGNHILFLYNPSLSTTPNEGREVLLPEIIRKTATERLPLGQVDEAGDLGRQSTSGAMDVSRNSMTIITIQYIVLYIYIYIIMPCHIPIQCTTLNPFSRDLFSSFSSKRGRGVFSDSTERCCRDRSTSIGRAVIELSDRIGLWVRRIERARLGVEVGRAGPDEANVHLH